MKDNIYTGPAKCMFVLQSAFNYRLISHRQQPISILFSFLIIHKENYSSSFIFPTYHVIIVIVNKILTMIICVTPLQRWCPLFGPFPPSLFWGGVQTLVRMVCGLCLGKSSTKCHEIVKKHLGNAPMDNANFMIGLPQDVLKTARPDFSRPSVVSTKSLATCRGNIKHPKESSLLTR